VLRLAVVAVAWTDFPDALTVRRRLCQFEREFVAALCQRHSSLAPAARLDIVSLALHLQSRPARRTVSLLQYLSGAVPRRLIDPHAGDHGDYIVTVPDALFYAAMAARLPDQLTTSETLNDDGLCPGLQTIAVK